MTIPAGCFPADQVWHSLRAKTQIEEAYANGYDKGKSMAFTTLHRP
jgi:hypothetical protein